MPQQLEDDGDRLFVRDLEGRVDGQALQVSRDPPLPDAFGDGVAAAFENAGRVIAVKRGAHRIGEADGDVGTSFAQRSEEHTSELQSLMRISYAVFCLKKKKKQKSRDKQ